MWRHIDVDFWKEGSNAYPSQEYSCEGWTTKCVRREIWRNDFEYILRIKHMVWKVQTKRHIWCCSQNGNYKWDSWIEKVLLLSIHTVQIWRSYAFSSNHITQYPHLNRRECQARVIVAKTKASWEPSEGEWDKVFCMRPLLPVLVNMGLHVTDSERDHYDWEEFWRQLWRSHPDILEYAWRPRNISLNWFLSLDQRLGHWEKAAIEKGIEWTKVNISPIVFPLLLLYRTNKPVVALAWGLPKEQDLPRGLISGF